MRVLDTYTGQFKDIDPEDTDVKYAILSHTWDKSEQTHGELRDIQQRCARKHQPTETLPPHSQTPPSDSPTLRSPSEGRTHSGWWRRLARLIATALLSSRTGRDQNDSSPAAAPSQLPHNPPSTTPATPESVPPPNTSPDSALTPMWDDTELSPKIREACRIAREKGYRYLWIDSCCIDKTSSSELSESINSMYKWYARADVCYAFLPDVPAEEDHNWKDSSFRRSRWFKRGWTLQELIAPLDVVFLAQDWTVIGTKVNLGDLVEEVTNIDYDALLHIEPLQQVQRRPTALMGCETTDDQGGRPGVLAARKLRHQYAHAVWRG